MVNGRVCANCFHVEDEHEPGLGCWGKPTVRSINPTPGCRCKGFAAKRGEVKIEMNIADYEKREERLVAAFERIATALETIAWKQAVTLVAGSTDAIPAANPPYQWQYPVISSVPAPLNNGVEFTSSEAVSQPDGFATFSDLEEGKPLRVGSGG